MPKYTEEMGNQFQIQAQYPEAKSVFLFSVDRRPHVVVRRSKSNLTDPKQKCNHKRRRLESFFDIRKAKVGVKSYVLLNLL